jgi:hypothetical protein
VWKARLRALGEPTETRATSMPTTCEQLGVASVDGRIDAVGADTNGDSLANVESDDP